MLSADSTEDRKVEALEAGADDYVTKPSGMRELNARLRVALRHRAAESGDGPTELQTGPLRLDLAHYEATFEGRDERLGPGLRRRAQLPQGLRLRIRRKLGDEDGRFLRSDPSIGYRLAWRGD